MRNEILRRFVVILSVAVLIVGPGVNPLLSQTRTVTGRVAGSVVDRASGMPVEGATIEARRVTINEAFTSPRTDALGSYLIESIPAGVYAITISHDGVSYPVEEHFDVRTAEPFLLEACFELDRAAQTALIQADCHSGLYAERQVVALGAHRYFHPDMPPAAPPQGGALNIMHSGLECFPRGVFPQIYTDIVREINVAIARVFFRASAHPDFYSIDLETTPDGFRGTFPQASPETEEVIYYVEALDTDFNPVQTTEFRAPVMPIEECRDRDPAAAYFTGADPGITVTATRAGAPVQPPGFLPNGIATFISASGTATTAAALAAGGAAAGGGGGLGTLGLILVIGGASAGTTAFVVAATKEDEASDIR